MTRSGRLVEVGIDQRRLDWKIGVGGWDDGKLGLMEGQRHHEEKGLCEKGEVNVGGARCEMIRGGGGHRNQKR